MCAFFVRIVASVMFKLVHFVTAFWRFEWVFTTIKKNKCNLYQHFFLFPSHCIAPSSQILTPALFIILQPSTSSVTSDEKVDYVQVDKEKTQALQSTMQEWTDVRQSTEPAKGVKSWHWPVQNNNKEMKQQPNLKSSITSIAFLSPWVLVGLV